MRLVDTNAAIAMRSLIAGRVVTTPKSSIATRYYLVSKLQLSRVGYNPEAYRGVSPGTENRCQYTAQTVTRKGETVNIGQSFKTLFTKYEPPGAMLVYHEAVYLCEEDVCPEYVTDPRRSHQ